MNDFITADQMFASVLRQLLNTGSWHDSRIGGSLEIIGWSGRLLRPDANVVLNPARGLKAYYAAAELLWYLSGKREIDMVEFYAPSYKQFANDGKAMGAYGYRWRHNPGFEAKKPMHVLSEQLSQIQVATELLRDKSNTRQAIVTMWDSGDLWNAKAGTIGDVPCTMTMQFLLREGRLHLIVNMRSNDAWLGLPYDVFCFTSVQQIVANELGAELGDYVHNVGSMHLYDKNKDKAIDAVTGQRSVGVVRHDWNARTGDVDEALMFERGGRTWRSMDWEANAAKMQPGMMRDLVLACWRKAFAKRDGDLGTFSSFDARAMMTDGPLKALADGDLK